MKIFNTLEDWLYNLWIVKAIDEIRDMRFLYKKTKKNKEYLEKYDLRLDWLGRPYTVINVPENAIQKDHDVEAFLILQLRKFDAIFIKLELVEIIYPEITRIEREDAYAFVYAFKTKFDNLRFLRVFGHLIKYTFIFFIIRIFTLLIMRNSTIFIDALDFIKGLF